MNSHQKQALTFMLKREQGLAYDEPGKDVWSKDTNSKGETMCVVECALLCHESANEISDTPTQSLGIDDNLSHRTFDLVFWQTKWA
jgi:hypothetical protein